MIYTAEMEPHTLQWAQQQYEDGDPVRRPGKQWISHNTGWAAVYSYMSDEDRIATDWESYSEVASKDPRSVIT